MKPCAGPIFRSPGDGGSSPPQYRCAPEVPALARFHRTIRLRDGRTATVAPLTPSDADELGDAIRHADPETLHRRFCGPPPPVTPGLLRRLTELDYRGRFAVVARDPHGHGVAVGRYEVTADQDVADLAVVVDPAWRRAGLATALVRILAEAALSAGISRFSATYLAENRPVAALLDKVNVRRIIADGVAEATVPLPVTDTDAREPGESA